MLCNNCGNDCAYRLRIHGGSESCDRCGALSTLSVPDVYFPGPYLDPNLAHPSRPHEKDGVWVTSRSHKAQLMREQNIHEVGDKHHGSRNFERSAFRNDDRRHTYGIKE